MVQLFDFLFICQIKEEVEHGAVGAVPLPPDCVGMDMVIASLVANVEAMISAERESAALKQLQVSYYVFKYRMLILWENMSQSFYNPHLLYLPIFVSCSSLVPRQMTAYSFTALLYVNYWISCCL